MTVSMLACPGCRAPVVGVESGGVAECPRCKAQLTLAVFPALGQGVASGIEAAPIASTDEAACFYHASKRAAVPCDACGRFLCNLCDVELNGHHYCPPCVDGGSRKGTIRELERQRTRRDTAALAFAVYTLVPPLWFVMPLTGLGAIITALWYWKSPPSLVDNSRARLVTALVLGGIELLGGTALWIAILKS